MKTTLITIGILASVMATFLTYVQVTFRRDFQPPLTGIKSTMDTAVIARGKYLVLGSGHCYTCHMPDSMARKGYKEEMIGGNAFETPFATFYTPNITSDKETGIGSFSDEQLARAIRYNVNHNNKAMVGFMAYNGMTDEDVTAVISYLRSTRPIRNEVPQHEFNMLGKILMRFMIKPVSPNVEDIQPDTSAAYGKYLAYNVMNCNGCHTKRGKTGEFIGEPFAGGYSWDLEDGSYSAANLTPDDSTGRITRWSQEVFIRRFRAGGTLPNSPMPWEAYTTISDNDLKAIYQFLQQLPAVRNNVVTYGPKSSLSASSQ